MRESGHLSSWYFECSQLFFVSVFLGVLAGVERVLLILGVLGGSSLVLTSTPIDERPLRKSPFIGLARDGPQRWGPEASHNQEWMPLL